VLNTANVFCRYDDDFMNSNSLNADAFYAYAAQGFNRVGLTRRILADLDTPLSLYLKLANAPNTFLLESVVGGERSGRFSFIGLPCRQQVRCTIAPASLGGNMTEVLRDGVVQETHQGDPLQFISDYQARYVPLAVEGLPRFCGGLAGYFGYDVVRVMEERLANTHKTGGLPMPDIVLLHSDSIVVIDNVLGTVTLVHYADPNVAHSYETAQAELNAWVAKINAPPLVYPNITASITTTPQRNYDHAQYLKDAQTCKDYIIAGDCMQVQLGQRISQPFSQEPLTLYRALRSINPSPYMYYYWIDTAGCEPFHIVGASPEILVRQEPVMHAGKEIARTVVVRPLAGTRKRGTHLEHDAALAAELLADPKERAEHVMLIDLARNDIGRIAKTGSVKVLEQMVIEKYSHVQHIVSHVEGTLLAGLNNMDVLRATFPAGTLTGAPKVRAMEIIDELEPVKRGIYGGAVGYLSYSGAMDVAIAIRTGIVQNGTLYAQASAGLVADSVVEAEYQETEAKARAVLRAAELVQTGL
jgi:anthranilate synthase component I